MYNYYFIKTAYLQGKKNGSVKAGPLSTPFLASELIKADPDYYDASKDVEYIIISKKK